MITAEQIWAAYGQEDDFEPLLNFPKVAQVVETYVRTHLLTALKPLLDQPVNPSLILRACREIVADGIAQGLTGQILLTANPKPADEIEAEDINALSHDWDEALTEVVQEYDKLLAEPHHPVNGNWHQARGLTEMQMYERVGLSLGNQSAALLGTLTLSQLLVSQPSIVLRLIVGRKQAPTHECSGCCGGCDTGGQTPSPDDDSGTD